MHLLNTFSMASLLVGAVYSHPYADAYADASPYASPDAYPEPYADAYADAYASPFFYAAPQAYRLQRRTDYTMPSSGSMTIKCPDGVTTLTIRGSAGAKFTYSNGRVSGPGAHLVEVVGSCNHNNHDVGQVDGKGGSHSPDGGHDGRGTGGKSTAPGVYGSGRRRN